MSDNGGRLAMPGQKGKQLPRNHPLPAGKGSMYEGGLRVPFMAIGPGIQAGSVSRVPVTGLDLFARSEIRGGVQRRALPRADGKIGSRPGQSLPATRTVHPVRVIGVDEGGRDTRRAGSRQSEHESEGTRPRVTAPAIEPRATPSPPEGDHVELDEFRLIEIVGRVPE